jgi:hypothetical protein
MLEEIDDGVKPVSEEPLSDAVAALPREEQAAFKAEAVKTAFDVVVAEAAEVALPVEVTEEVDGKSRVAVVFDGPPVGVDGVLWLVLFATVDGKPVFIDNPVYVVNPPLLVPDLAGKVVRTAVDADGNVVETRFREDPAAALQQIALDVVRSAVR